MSSILINNNNLICNDKDCPPDSSEKTGVSNAFASLCARISKLFSCFVSCLWNRNSQTTSEPPMGKETDVIFSNSFSLMNVGNNQKKHNFNEATEQNSAYLLEEYDLNATLCGVNPITHSPQTIDDQASTIGMGVADIHFINEARKTIERALETTTVNDCNILRKAHKTISNQLALVAHIEKFYQQHPPSLV